MDLDFHPFVTPSNRGKIVLPSFTSEVVEPIEPNLSSVAVKKTKAPKPKVVHIQNIDSFDDLFLVYNGKVPGGPKKPEFKKIIKLVFARTSYFRTDIRMTDKTVREDFSKLKSNGTTMNVDEKRAITEALFGKAS